MAQIRTNAPAIVSWAFALALGLLTAPLIHAQVTVLTVGPSGTYATIQGAIDAVVNGADTEIRVEQNQTYTENLEVPATFNSGSLSILGGWDVTFSTRDPDPEHTVIDGDASGRALNILIEGGSLLVDGITFTNGKGDGAGVRVFSTFADNDAQIVIRNNWIAENHYLTSTSAFGGGLYAYLNGTQRLEILDSLIYRNTSTASSPTGNASGGGIFIQARDDSTYLVDGCDVYENSVVGNGGQRAGGGLYLSAERNSKGLIYDTFMFGNTILGTGTSKGSGGSLKASGTAIVEVVRSGWAENTVDSGDATAQLFYEVEGGSHVLRMTDSGLAQGDSGGLEVHAASNGSVQLVNLTVADHPGTGILATQEDTSTLAIYNTISYDNGTDLTTSGTIDTGSNLIGVDPLFVDPLNLDYFLSAGSPAENMGDNYPPGGLSPVDIEGSSRIVDGIVDIGFAEGIDVIFACSFETGDLTTWVDDRD
jgi:hypothetical protein